MKTNKQTTRKASLKKAAVKTPFYAHLLSVQESKEIVGGMSLKYPSDRDENGDTTGR